MLNRIKEITIIKTVFVETPAPSLMSFIEQTLGFFLNPAQTASKTA